MMLQRIPVAWNGGFDRRFERQFDRLVQSMLQPFVTDAPRAFTPAVDVREEADAILLLVDVPGVRPEDLKLSFENGVLTLSGERKEDAGDRAATYHRCERAWGRFERSFSLPADVDGEHIEASYANGVLTVRLSKRPEARARTIEIKTA